MNSDLFNLTFYEINCYFVRTSRGALQPPSGSSACDAVKVLLRTDRNGRIELSTDVEQIWVEVEYTRYNI